MMTLHDLKLRARALFAPRRVERELDEELTFHLERETRKLVEQGLDPAEARTRALARFGSVALAADACRDTRGTAFVDNTVRDILYAFRTFQRAPLTACTIVSTVALGLGLVAVAFTILSTFLFRLDVVPAVHEMYAVERPRTGPDERPRFTRAQYDALRRDTTVFVDAYAELSDLDSRIDGRVMAGTLVTGNFFQVLGVSAALGRALTPADDEAFAGQQVMVLSHRGWERLFAKDPTVLGRQLRVNGFPYEIIGVMPEGFRGLSVGPPDYWAPLALVGHFRRIHGEGDEAVGIDIVGRLRPGMTPQTALAALAVWDAGQPTADATERRTANITLVARNGTLPERAEALLLFSPLFFAFGLILMIGCANVANLLLARGVARQREFGIRLSLGASRRRIIRQLLTESLLLALVSAAAGFAVSRVALTAIVHTVMTSMAPDLAENVRVSVPASDWRVLLFLVVGAVMATGFFGLVPALQATRVEPIRTIRGEVMRDAKPGRARNLLIGLQVSASALLLICSAVFLRSALASATVDPGIRTADTVIIQIVNEPTRDAMVRAVVAEPSVAAVAATWPGPLDAPRAAFAEVGGNKSTVAYKFTSPEYFAVFDIPIVRGRGFTAAERTTDAAVTVVSESVARELWPAADAVGQALQLDAAPDAKAPPADEPTLATRRFTVVGVARDVPGFRMADFKEAGVYLPIDTTSAQTSLIVRVHGDPDQARRALLERLVIVDPNMGQVVTMRTLARMETYFLQIGFWATLVLGGLALVLTLSGLFSVLSYLVEQRRKEIGVRMALGATTRTVSRMVLSQLIRPVSTGLLIGGGTAAGLATILMATPAAASIGAIVHVFDPVAYLASLLCIVTACALAAALPARRAARIDPVNTLRQD